jgi:hypothetical protein
MEVKTVNKFDRHRSMKNAICIGLALVLLAVLFRAFGSTPSGASASPGAGNGSAPSQSADLHSPAAQAITIEIPDTLPRDLFDASVAFPPEVPVSSTAPTTPATKPHSAADDRAAIAAEARSTIVLDATMLGSDPTALINGRQCRVGNVVKGFTVRKIAADHVVIERDGVRLKVSYAKPGNAKD